MDKLERAYKPTVKTPTKTSAKPKAIAPGNLKLWYCRQCGYVCFREEPPYVCPICKAKRELFSEVNLNPER